MDISLTVCSLKHLPDVQTSFSIYRKSQVANFGLGKAYGTKLKGQQFRGQPGWLSLQPTGNSGKATKPSLQLSKRGDLKAGRQSLCFHLKLHTEAAFHPRNSPSSCTKEHKTLLGAGAAVWRWRRVHLFQQHCSPCPVRVCHAEEKAYCSP